MPDPRTGRGNSTRAGKIGTAKPKNIPLDYLQDTPIGQKNRTTSDIKVITARDKLSQKENTSRQKTLGSEVTPAKGSNLKYTTRKQIKEEVLRGFIAELQDRRWRSADLVEHAFGGIVSGELAAFVALHFLHSNILTVYKPGGSQLLERSEWPKACIDALVSAESTAHPPTGPANIKDDSAYVWKWNNYLVTGTELGAETFFNTVRIAAYAAAGATNAAGQLDGRKPTVRFTTLPRQHHALPLPNSDDRQDCRPDFFALPTLSFVSGCPPGRDSSELLGKQSPLSAIHSRFSRLLEPYHNLQKMLQTTGNRAGKHIEYGPSGVYPPGKLVSGHPRSLSEDNNHHGSSTSVVPVLGDLSSSPLSSPPPSPPQIELAVKKVAGSSKSVATVPSDPFSSPLSSPPPSPLQVDLTVKTAAKNAHVSSLSVLMNDKIDIKDRFQLPSTPLPMIDIERLAKENESETSNLALADITAPVVAPLAATPTSILKQLRDLHTKIIAGKCPRPPENIQNALFDYSRRNYLDLSYVCVPNIIIPGEDKATKVRHAVVQACVYMRQRRRAQPWLRYSYGLIATSSILGLLRADATGVEECIFDKETSCGMISAIRLALGVTLASELEFGCHPSLTLRWKTEPSDNAYTSAPEETIGDKRNWHPDLDDSDGTYGQAKNTKKARGKETPITADKLPVPRDYRYREVNSITLFNSDLHPPSGDASQPEKTVYFVKYLLDDRGSLIGSLGRIWCVYKELGYQEKVQRGQNPNHRVFEGPYALKIFYMDIHRSNYKLDLLSTLAARSASSFAQMENVFWPTSVWYLGKVLTIVRGFLEDTDGPQDLIPSGFKNREEIVMLTPFKRTLGEFTTGWEFYMGILDAIRGITQLEKAGFIHRDISIGNILLAEDDVLHSPDRAVYTDENEDCTEIILVSRPKVPFGGLHDLEMLAHIPEEDKLVPKPRKDQLKTADDLMDKLVMTGQALTTDLLLRSHPAPKEDVAENSLAVTPDKARDLRTGTPAFMSIRVLETDGISHNVVDDMQSLFYVVYLSMFIFNYPARSDSSSKGSNFRLLPVELPDDILLWAESQGLTYRALAKEKMGFFQRDTDDEGPSFLRRWLESAQPFWMQEDTRSLHGYVLKLLYESLWKRTEASESDLEEIEENSTRPPQAVYVPRRKVNVNQILKKLEDKLNHPAFKPLRNVVEDPSVRRSSRLSGKT